MQHLGEESKVLRDTKYESISVMQTRPRSQADFMHYSKGKNLEPESPKQGRSFSGRVLLPCPV